MRQVIPPNDALHRKGGREGKRVGRGGGRVGEESSDNREWREEAPAQVTVAADAWLEAVRLVAGRHNKAV